MLDIGVLYASIRPLKEIFKALQIDNINGRNVSLTPDMKLEEMKQLVSSAQQVDLINFMFPDAP
jgi:hypothetical protein